MVDILLGEVRAAFKSEIHPKRRCNSPILFAVPQKGIGLATRELACCEDLRSPSNALDKVCRLPLSLEMLAACEITKPEALASLTRRFFAVVAVGRQQASQRWEDHRCARQRSSASRLCRKSSLHADSVSPCHCCPPLSRRLSRGRVECPASMRQRFLSVLLNALDRSIFPRSGSVNHEANIRLSQSPISRSSGLV